MNNLFFKQCLVCQQGWETREAFATDDGVVLIGYQANFVSVANGLFLFNHSCGGTMSIPVEAFADLYTGPVYVERQTGSAACPGYCLHHNDLRPCPAKCECAYVREILALLTKSGAPSPQ